MQLDPNIRVALADIPGLMRGVISNAIACQPDMSVVAELARAPDTGGGASQCSCDVVITALTPDGQIPSVYQALLFSKPHTPLITVDPDGGRLQAYDRTVVHQFAIDDLLAEIRRVAIPRQNYQVVD